jgi:tRNA(fMet)-specific endonuclease VapC
MKYLLDSNILIGIAVAQNDQLRANIAECDAGDLATSAISFAEVAYGSMRGKPPLLDDLRVLTEEVEVLPFDNVAALVYASLPFKRASYDRLIAAHALSLGLTVVTDNEADFADVPGLRVENWTV